MPGLLYFVIFGFLPACKNGPGPTTQATQPRFRTEVPQEDGEDPPGNSFTIPDDMI
jgi:hypothetical protein